MKLHTGRKEEWGKHSTRLDSMHIYLEKKKGNFWLDLDQFD